MFTEILKIIPKLDAAALSGMEKALNNRFTRVAKKFGGGLMNIIKGGGIVGAVTVLLNKVLNPLKDVQEALDRTLNRGDDLATFAKQFNTTAGNLARLQAFGRATGLDPEGVRLLLGKFQAAVAQSAANPDQETSVSRFVGRKDTAEAFFEFIQSMQKLSATQQNLVQQEVFGEKQILKASEFLNADFRKLQMMFTAMGAPTAAQLTGAAEWIGQQSDNLDIARAAREQADLVKKARLINDGVINSVIGRENFDAQRENQNLSAFAKLEALQIGADKIVARVEKAFNNVAPLIGPALESLPAIADKLINLLNAVEKSRVVRGLVPGVGKDK